MCCLFPFGVMAQNKVIEFQTFGNWQEVLDKAKEEKKTIFVDAYATWCGPCKKMDVDVYTDPKVAEYVSTNFIAIKLQMDQAKNDPESIKSWYADATELQKKYQIEAMPTFLFLDAFGSIIYKGEGYRDVDAFLAFVKAANDPNENYPGKIAQYKSGLLKGRDLLLLALEAKKYHEDSLAVQIARRYKITMIDHITPTKVLTPEFTGYFTSFSNLLFRNDPIVKFMYKEPVLADSLLSRKGYSKQMTEYFIARDILNPLLLKNNKITLDTPNWAALESKVAKLYDTKTAKGILISYKVAWYQNKEDWHNYVKYAIEKQDFYGIDTSTMGRAFLNNFVYNVILKYSNNPVFLNKGLDYMKIALENREDDDASLDTYANVLYKLGRKDEALNTEARALVLAKQKKNDENVKIYQETIQKMESGLPVPLN
jgi:thioredoxin-related protein